MLRADRHGRDTVFLQQLQCILGITQGRAQDKSFNPLFAQFPDRAQRVRSLLAFLDNDVRICVMSPVQQPPQHGAEEGVVRVDVDEADGDRVGAGQAARRLVGTVAEFLDRLLDFIPRRRPNVVLVVDDPGHRHRRNAGHSGDVVNGNISMLSAAAAWCLRTQGIARDGPEPILIALGSGSRCRRAKSTVLWYS